MIKFEKPEVWGWEHAIRGMRNPLNSWERSDSYPTVDCGKCGIIDREGICHPKEHDCTPYECYAIGDNDKDLLNMLEYRRGHKLDEWRMFCDWILTLPYGSLLKEGVGNEQS